jgi:hypothetical protein
MMEQTSDEHLAEAGLKLSTMQATREDLAMVAMYQPIENYGVIGNLRTAALVGMNGSIDWLCLPHFDSPSVFAAILDDEKGGRFRIAPAGDNYRHKQFYWPDTAILVTRFLRDDGVGEIEDYMPVRGGGGAGAEELVRRVRVVRGRVPFRLECRPAFESCRRGLMRFSRPVPNGDGILNLHDSRWSLRINTEISTLNCTCLPRNLDSAREMITQGRVVGRLLAQRPNS